MLAKQDWVGVGRFGIVALWVMMPASAQACQLADFPDFDDIMREADLPRLHGQIHQPVAPPKSNWPPISSLQSPRRDTSERGDLGSPRPPERELPRRSLPETDRRDRRFTPSNQRLIADDKDNRFEDFGLTEPEDDRDLSIRRWNAADSSKDASSPRPANPFSRPKASPVESSDAWPSFPGADRVEPRSSREFPSSGRIPINPVGQSRPLNQDDSRWAPDNTTYQDYEAVGADRRRLPMRHLEDEEFDINIGDIPLTEEDVFDWRTFRVSAADLLLPLETNSGPTLLRHGRTAFSAPEQNVYLDLVQEIEKRRDAIDTAPIYRKLSANARVAVWEESFYAYGRARQLAWNNGRLRGKSKTVQSAKQFSDPFKSPATGLQSEQTRSSYHLLDDLRNYPDHFTGRPIVLYGMFTPESRRTLERRDANNDPTINSVEEESLRPELTQSSTYGFEYDLENQLVKATVMTGSLTSAHTGQLLATVDTSGLLTPNQGHQDIRSAWTNMSPFPVLVKGWVIKKHTGDRPLVYCESMRLLSPEPHHALVTTHTLDKQDVSQQEKWLFYETIHQLQQTRTDLQAKLARQNILNRIEALRQEVVDKLKTQAEALSAKQKAGELDASQFERKAGSLKRRLQQRLDRYTQYRSEPEKFPAYVDLFQNPNAWQGQMITLRGHVRHAVSYDSDPAMTSEKQLHELWLFTEDSQHTPAVIVTPELPADFPIDAESIDHVTVTGCVFKRYVYDGQTERRIAPLILAGRIQWAPSVSHVASLVKSGNLSAGSPLAAKARELEKRQSGGFAMVIVSLLIIFGLMVLWGRAQREERDRLRLRDRITDVVEIENGPPPEYASAADEYFDRIR